MSEQRRKFLITLFSSVGAVCVALAGAVGFMILRSPADNPIQAAAGDWVVEFHSGGGTDGANTVYRPGDAAPYPLGASTVDVTFPTLTDAGFNRYGYEFKGWALSAGLGYDVLTNGEVANQNRSVTKSVSGIQENIISNGVLRIYAQWSPREYNITFSAAAHASLGNGAFPASFGTEPGYGSLQFERGGYYYGDDAVILTSGELPIVIEPQHSNTNLDFVGWYFDYDDNKYTAPNGDPIRVMKGDEVNLLVDNGIPERGTAQSPFDTFADNEITLYANWSAGNYRVNYFLNAPADRGPEDVTYTDASGQEQTSSDPDFPSLMAGRPTATHSFELNAPRTLLPTSSYTIKGYKFTGWSILENPVPAGFLNDQDPDIAGIQVVNLASVKYGSIGAEAENLNWEARRGLGRVDVYATWEAITYTIIYDIGPFARKKADFDGTPPTQTATYDQTTANDLPGNDFYENVGHTFLGWTKFLGSQGGGGFVLGAGKDLSGYTSDKVGDMAIYPNGTDDDDDYLNFITQDGGEIVLYPVWKKSKYNVEFMLDGGTLKTPYMKDEQPVYGAPGVPPPSPNGEWSIGAAFPSGVDILGADGRRDETYLFIGWFTTDMQPKDVNEAYIDALIKGVRYEGNGNGFMNFAPNPESPGDFLPVIDVDGKSWSHPRLDVELIPEDPDDTITLWARYIKLKGSMTIHSKVEDMPGGGVDIRSDAYLRGNSFEFDYYGQEGMGENNGNQLNFGVNLFELVGLYYDAHYTDREPPLVMNTTTGEYRLRHSYRNPVDGTLRKEDVVVNGETLPGAFVGRVNFNNATKKWIIPADFAGSSLTLFARWERSTKTNQIRYYDKDGREFTAEELPDHPREFEYAVGITVRDRDQLVLKDPTKDGYKFMGWYRNNEYTGEEVLDLKPGVERGSVLLYAKWEPDEYKIYYRNTDGTPVFAPGPDGERVDTVYFGDVVPLENGSRFGYTFAGWYESTEDNAVPIIGNYLPEEYAESVILYAKWTPNKYTVELFQVQGHASDATVVHTYDTETLLPGADTLTSAGYDFVGWYWNFDSNTGEFSDAVADGKLPANMPAGSWLKFDEEGNPLVTLFAKWVPKTFTISYMDATYVSSGDVILLDKSFPFDTDWYAENNLVSYETYTFDAPRSLPLNEMVRRGYKFQFWRMKEEGSDRVKMVTQGFLAAGSISSDTTLYASWSPVNIYIDKKYSFETGYDDVDKPVASHKDKASSEYDFEHDTELGTASAPGYIFEGWFFDKDDSFEEGTESPLGRISILEKGKYATDEELGTLYAHWTVEKYEIEFDLNLGDDNTAPAEIQGLPVGGRLTHTYNADTMLPVQFGTPGALYTIKRDKYTFVAWEMEVAGGARVSYTKFEKSKPALDFGDGAIIKLYASWRPNEYSIKYYDVGGNEEAVHDYTGTGGYAPPTTHTYGTETRLWNPIRAGYVFEGWYYSYANASENAPVPFGDDGTTYTIPATYAGVTNLYAKWRNNQYGVNIDIRYVDNEFLDVEGEIFKNNDYDDVFNAADYNNYVNQALPSLYRRGYNFMGWFYEDGSTIVGNEIPGSLLTTDGASITVYAQFDWIEYEIDYRLSTLTTPTIGNSQYTIWSGSKIKYDDYDYEEELLNDKGLLKYYRYGVEIPLPTAERPGYTWDGWYLNGVKVTSLSDTTFFESAITQYTLQDSWVVEEYRLDITSNLNNNIAGDDAHYGHDDETFPQAHVFGNSGTVGFPEYGSQKTGYTFDGWYLGGEKLANNELGQYVDYTDKLVDNVLTIIGQWSLIEYRVQYKYVDETNITNDKLAEWGWETTYTFESGLDLSGYADDIPALGTMNKALAKIEKNGQIYSYVNTTSIPAGTTGSVLGGDTSVLGTVIYIKYYSMIEYKYALLNGNPSSGSLPEDWSTLGIDSTSKGMPIGREYVYGKGVDVGLPSEYEAYKLADGKTALVFDYNIEKRPAGIYTLNYKEYVFNFTDTDAVYGATKTLYVAFIDLPPEHPAATARDKFDLDYGTTYSISPTEIKFSNYSAPKYQKIQDALGEYDDLQEIYGFYIKGLLVGQKAKLDNLQNRIDALIAIEDAADDFKDPDSDTFSAELEAALELEVATLTIDDADTVADAVSDGYNTFRGRIINEYQAAIPDIASLLLPEFKSPWLPSPTPTDQEQPLYAEWVKLNELSAEIARLNAELEDAENELDEFEIQFPNIFTLTVGTVGTNNSVEVNGALAKYQGTGAHAGNGLSAKAKELLNSEYEDEYPDEAEPFKAFLDALLAKIELLQANDTAVSKFRSDHNEALNYAVNETNLSNYIARKVLVDAALEAFDDLSQPVKALLTEEKIRLDSLETKIADCVLANGFINGTHKNTLALTTATVTEEDEDRVNDAKTAFNGLSAAVRSVLSEQGALLDALSDRIELLGDVTEAFDAVKEGFLEDAAVVAALALDVNTVTTGHGPQVVAAQQVYTDLFTSYNQSEFGNLLTNRLDADTEIQAALNLLRDLANKIVELQEEEG